MDAETEYVTTVFQNEQRFHGKNITDVFAVGTLRSALLWADVQVGKTGTYHYVIRAMLKSHTVKHVYILCGSSEVTLRTQAHADLMKYNADFREKITIIFRNDFKKAAMNTTDALIVVDESHLDQTVGQQLDRFLVGHGLYLDGTTPEMTTTNTFILTVDATPYSEYAAHFHGKSRPKHIEKFVPSDLYYGIKNYMEDGHIETTFDFRTDAGKRRMTALMERYPRKYLMFRIEGVGNEARAKIIRQICRVKRFNFLEYTEGKHMIAITRAEQTDASMPCMEDEPAKTTVILVKGRLRAGKVVPKAHVGFVWENATNPRTDSIVQGLLGRMCGYLGTSVFQVPLGGDVKPRIFLPQAVLEKKTDTVVPLSELDRHLARDSDILPRCGTNLKKTTVAAAPDNGRTQVATLMIKRELFGEDVEYFESGERNREHMKRMCLDTLKAHADEILAQHPVGTITDDQKAEIRTRVESAEVNQVMSRMLDGNKHHSGAANSYYKQLRAAYASHSVPKEHIEGSPYMTFAIVLAPRNEAGARPGDVYVVMYTDAANTGFGTVSARDKVAEENGKSLFGVRVREAAIAGGAATLDSNATRSPVDFMAAMGEYLDMSRRGVYVHHEKTIVPVADKFVFDKVAFEYVNSRTNALEQSIKPTLERMYGIRVKITYNSGPSGRTTFTVKKISWE